MNKGGYEFSFAWIFTIMIGAVIIFLAIYAAFEFSDTLRFGRDSATAKKIGVILTPLDTTVESAKSFPLIISQETSLYNNCVKPSASLPFGTQEISVAIKTDVGRREDDELTPGVKSRFNNKYIFSDNKTTAENQFYAISKPFKYPFKIADLTIIWSDQDEYCFVDTSLPDLKREILDLNLENIELTDEKCDDKINICYNDDSCNISYTDRTVTKKGFQPVKYVRSTETEDQYALLFAAIFSHPEDYNCQLNRLAARAISLADLLWEKNNLLTGNNNCPRLGDKLELYSDQAISEAFSNNPDLSQISTSEVRSANAGCKPIY